MQIQDFPRKLAPGDSDLLLIQDSTDNAYKSIEKSSLGGGGGGGGDFEYAKLSDTKPSGTVGGSYSAATVIARTLNTVDVPKSWVSLADNQFMLAAGSYLISASSPAYRVNRFKIWLHNVTDNQDPILGTGSFSASDVTATSSINGLVSISSNKTFQINFYGQSSSATFGLGVQSNVPNQTEVYTVVEIIKIG